MAVEVDLPNEPARGVFGIVACSKWWVKGSPYSEIVADYPFEKETRTITGLEGWVVVRVNVVPVMFSLFVLRLLREPLMSMMMK